MKEFILQKNTTTVKKFVTIIFALVITTLQTAKAESLIYDESCVTDGLTEFKPMHSRYQNFDNLDTIIASDDRNSTNYFTEFDTYTMSAGRTSIGLRCEDLNNFRYGLEVMKITALPALMALRSPAVHAQLIELGLTAANPAVLGVTVLGASGYVVIYLILKKTIEECDAMAKDEFRKSIIKEMQIKYGLKIPKNIPIQSVR